VPVAFFIIIKAMSEDKQNRNWQKVIHKKSIKKGSLERLPFLTMN
jgi:hypothetical protein